MSTMELEQPGGGIPDGDGPGAQHPQRRTLKVLMLLAILAALAWVLLLAVQYFLKSEPLTRLPVVPGALVGERPPEYLATLRDTEQPLGLAAIEGRIYIAESSGDRLVRALDSEGVEVATFAPPDSNSLTRLPLYVAVSPQGEVYVSDRFQRVINVYSPQGDHLRAFTPPEEAEGWHPMGITFDQRGNLYVTNVAAGHHGVLVFDRTGALKLRFGTEGTEPGRFWFPNGIAVDDRGRIFVADGNNGRLQAFNSVGQLLFVIPRGYAPGDLAMPRGVAVDGDDRLFVADAAAHTVKTYDVSGDLPRFLRSIGSQGIGESQLRFPIGVAVDGDLIYIADRQNGRVQIWSH
jgi:tripartite motif-containing protein 71